MNGMSEGQGQTSDDTARVAFEQPAAGSRRLLLGGAAGGLTLAASGLFLPAWLEETEAREGPSSGALVGQSKNHKSRQRRRNRKRRHRQNRNHEAPGKGPFRNVQFNIYNGQSSPQDVQVWVLTQDSNYNNLYTIKWNDRLAAGETREYKSEELYLLVTRPDYYSSSGGQIFALGFNNPIYFPSLSFGWELPGFSGYPDKLHESSVNIMKVGTNARSFGFNATRQEDTAYIRFRIELVAS